MRQIFLFLVCLSALFGGCNRQKKVTDIHIKKEEMPDVELSENTGFEKLQLKQATFHQEIPGNPEEAKEDYLELHFKSTFFEDIIFDKITSPQGEANIQKPGIQQLKIKVTDLKIQPLNKVNLPTLHYIQNNEPKTIAISEILIQEPIYRP